MPFDRRQFEAAMPPVVTLNWDGSRFDGNFQRSDADWVGGLSFTHLTAVRGAIRHNALKSTGPKEDYLGGWGGWWRSRFTPVHASWLDQAELLLDAFAYRYLKRGSWCSRADFIEHVEHAWPEYNRLYAHPFEWTWTNQKMRRWFADHEP